MNIFKRHERAVLICQAILVTVAIFVFFREWADTLWFGSNKLLDFKTYYYGALAAKLGLNPYDMSVISLVAGTELDRPYLYPPVSLWLFKWFTYLEFESAKALYFTIKTIAFVLLVVVWLKLFVQESQNKFLLIVTIVFGYHRATIIDMENGNISIFEQLLLWLGIYFLLQYSKGQSYILIIFAGACKLVNSGLAALFWVVRPDTKDIKWIVLGGSLFVLMHVFGYMYHTSLYVQYLDFFVMPAEFGDINPSSLALIFELVDGFSGNQSVVWLVYGGYVLLMAGLFIGVLWFHKNKRQEHPDSLFLIVLCLFFYVLVVPRMKDYSYVVLLLPSIYVINNYVRSAGYKFLLYALMWVHVVPYQAFLTALVLMFVLSAEYVRYVLLQFRIVPLDKTLETK